MSTTLLTTSRRSRLLVISAAVCTLLLIGSLTAMAAGSGTIEEPPAMAFVARSDVPADALAVGPVAGRFGAPVFTTPPHVLVPEALAGLVATDPDLVIIAGGSVAISPEVEAQIAAELNLAADQIVRVAGTDRHDTARLTAELIDEYNPAFLPVAATALDSAHLGGQEPWTYRNPSQNVEATNGGSLLDNTSSATARRVLEVEDVGPGTYLVAGQVLGTTAGTTTSRVICNTALGDDSVRLIGRIGSSGGYAGQDTWPVFFTATVSETSDLTVDCWAESVTGNAPSISGNSTHLSLTRVHAHIPGIDDPGFPIAP